MGKKKAATRGASKKAEDSPNAAASTGMAKDSSAPAVTPPSRQRNDRAHTSAEKTKAPLHVEDPRSKMIREHYGSGDWWFIQDYALANIATTLASQGWVCLDHFLSDAHTKALLSDVKRNGGGQSKGESRFQSGYLAGDGLGGGVRYSHSHVRGDEVFWSNGIEDEEKWSSFGNPALSFERGHTTLSLYLRRMDTLLAQLADPTAHNVAELAPLLGQVSDRSHAMVAHYPGGGAGYVRHCDNHCNEGDGNDCNGRRITAIVYLNEGWREADGGELLLYHPPPKHDDQWCRIAPRAGTAILFWSDYRVPHAVLPSYNDRYAVTTWYYDKDEKEAARSRAASDNTGERAAEHKAKVAREIAEFEARTGKKADTTIAGRYDGARLQEDLPKATEDDDDEGGSGGGAGAVQKPSVNAAAEGGGGEEASAQSSSSADDESPLTDRALSADSKKVATPVVPEVEKVDAAKLVPVVEKPPNNAEFPLDASSGEEKKGEEDQQQQEEQTVESVEARVAAEAAARERLLAKRAKARDELAKAKAQKAEEERRASEVRAEARAAEKAKSAAVERATAKAAAKAAKAAAARELRECEQAEALALEAAAAEARMALSDSPSSTAAAIAAECATGVELGEGAKGAQPKKSKKKGKKSSGPAAAAADQSQAAAAAAVEPTKSEAHGVVESSTLEKPATKTAPRNTTSVSTGSASKAPKAATAAERALTAAAVEAPRKTVSSGEEVEIMKEVLKETPRVVAAVLVRSPAGQTEFVFEPPGHQSTRILRKIVV